MSTDATPWGAARSLAIIRHLRRLKAIERHTCRRPAQPATLLKDRIPKEPPKIDRASRPTVWRLACTRARIPLTRAVTADLSRAGPVLSHRARVKKLEARSGSERFRGTKRRTRSTGTTGLYRRQGTAYSPRRHLLCAFRRSGNESGLISATPTCARKSSRWREARPSGSSFY
jgi:hypothetical protein